MKFVHSGENFSLYKGMLIFTDRGHYYQYNPKGGAIETTKDQYLTYKYGEDYQKLQTHLPEELSLYISGRNCNGLTVLSFFQESTIRIFSKSYDLLWEDTNGDMVIDTIYNAKIDKNFIWVVYPTAHTLAKYSLSSKKKLVEFTEIDGLCYPESLSIWKNNLYICNMGFKEVLVLGTDNIIYTVDKYAEPVWEYIKFEQHSYVKLESGIYLL